MLNKKKRRIVNATYPREQLEIPILELEQWWDMKQPTHMWGRGSWWIIRNVLISLLKEHTKMEAAKEQGEL